MTIWRTLFRNLKTTKCTQSSCLFFESKWRKEHLTRTQQLSSLHACWLCRLYPSSRERHRHASVLHYRRALFGHPYHSNLSVDERLPNTSLVKPCQLDQDIYIVYQWERRTDGFNSHWISAPPCCKFLMLLISVPRGTTTQVDCNERKEEKG